MPIPWLRLIDAALGFGDIVRRAGGRNLEASRSEAIASARGGLETRLAGVIVGALKEAFDRDHQRLELERQHLESERLRVERAMRLEQLRQAGEREIGRLRLVAGVALASWLGTLVAAPRLLEAVAGKVALGFGWLFLLAAMAQAFAEQGRIARTLATADDRVSMNEIGVGGGRTMLAPWLVVCGLAVVGFGVLIS
jgi:hypothetical protein